MSVLRKTNNGKLVKIASVVRCKPGFSPMIIVCEDADESYKLMIIDRYGSFITPNLKGGDTV